MTGYQEELCCIIEVQNNMSSQEKTKFEVDMLGGVEGDRQDGEDANKRQPQQLSWHVRCDEQR